MSTIVKLKKTPLLNYKQKFEYHTVVLTPKQQQFNWQFQSTTTTTITVNTVPQESTMVHHVNQTLLSYSAQGWRLKSTLYIDAEVMLIFERFTEDYALYSSEIQRYIESE